jgi:DNA-binding transcriptional LysR family regulator
MFNIRSVDLNLLPIFEAVYEARSLSRAAERLATSQSAVSHAVNRLRSVFRDELFVRHRESGAAPAADRTLREVRGALASIRESVVDMRASTPRPGAQVRHRNAHPLGR